ncbi:hypothetical protein BC829DRAFT_446695 [Chytridium lagenaria]|nr:hypothetical protein BC829DRAFT_446695 [Chytridium lagenaria]
MNPDFSRTPSTSSQQPPSRLISTTSQNSTPSLLSSDARFQPPSGDQRYPSSSTFPSSDPRYLHPTQDTRFQPSIDSRYPSQPPWYPDTRYPSYPNPPNTDHPPPQPDSAPPPPPHWHPHPDRSYNYSYGNPKKPDYPPLIDILVRITLTPLHLHHQPITRVDTTLTIVHIPSQDSPTRAPWGVESVSLHQGNLGKRKFGEEDAERSGEEGRTVVEEGNGDEVTVKREVSAVTATDGENKVEATDPTSPSKQRASSKPDDDVDEPRKTGIDLDRLNMSTEPIPRKPIPIELLMQQSTLVSESIERLKSCLGGREETEVVTALMQMEQAANAIQGALREVEEGGEWKMESPTRNGDDTRRLSMDGEDPVASWRKKRIERFAPPQQCSSCGATRTPEWRRGPNGPRTLCNSAFGNPITPAK